MSKKINILFIDDNSHARVLGEILRDDYKEQCNVTILTNLDNADYYLNYDPGQKYFDCIFVDITFKTRMDGWFFAKKAVDDWNCPQDKIIMYSARIKEISDSSNYPAIRMLDKNDPRLLDKALAMIGIMGDEYE